MDADGDLVDIHEGGVVVSDAELTALALAADPDAPLGDDAVPFDAHVDGPGLLPEWYMPAPQVSGGSRRRAAVFAVVVVSLLLLNAAGMCVTYGRVVIAW
ncbi:MAG: hypothetical protein AAB131_19190 [Actinomycetota bacterium]|jgi:hypothetical protein